HFEAKAIRSDNGAAVNGDVPPTPAWLANRDVRINVTLGPDHRLVSDIAACANDCVIADSCAGFDDRQRLNRNAIAQLNAWIDDRAGMNTGRETDSLWSEFEQYLFESFARIGNANLRG